MKKELILKYLLLGLPFIVGAIMYCLSIYNIVSSLLFFVGGYVFVKNILDYRKVRKNIKRVEVKEIFLDNVKKNCRSADSIPMIKRTRIHHRVRKRIKNIDF